MKQFYVLLLLKEEKTSVFWWNDIALRIFDCPEIMGFKKQYYSCQNTYRFAHAYNIVILKSKKKMPQHRKYSRITLKKRQDLVRMVLHERKLIAMVARRLSLKLPTARLIINKFLKTGTFTVKKAERTAEAVQPESPEPENNAVSEERLEVEPVNQNHFGDVNQQQSVSSWNNANWLWQAQACYWLSQFGCLPFSI